MSYDLHTRWVTIVVVTIVTATIVTLIIMYIQCEDHMTYCTLIQYNVIVSRIICIHACMSESKVLHNIILGGGGGGGGGAMATTSTCICIPEPGNR